MERTQVVGFEPFRRAAASGKGVILLTGHLGNWELGGAAIAARGIPLEVVAKGMSNRLFEQTLVRARERLGMRVIPMGDAPARALKALGDGGVVAILGDQSAHRGGVPVRFFGLAASTARGPALLAVRSGAPVFLGFAVRDPGWSQRYTLTFEALQFEPSGDVDRDVDLLLERYARFLEAAIERCPEQYFWQHRRWKSQPDGGTVIEGVGY